MPALSPKVVQLVHIRHLLLPKRVLHCQGDQLQLLLPVHPEISRLRLLKLAGRGAQVRTMACRPDLRLSRLRTLPSF